MIQQQIRAITRDYKNLYSDTGFRVSRFLGIAFELTLCLPLTKGPRIYVMLGVCALGHIRGVYILILYLPCIRPELFLSPLLPPHWLTVKLVNLHCLILHILLA